MTEDNFEVRSIVQVDVSGLHSHNVDLQGLRARFAEALNKILDSVINSERGSTVRDEGKKLIAAVFESATARLERHGLENDKLEAEVSKLYAQVETELAEARKKNAEAGTIELENAIKKLKLTAALMEVMLAGDEGEDAIAFGRQVNGALRVLGARASTD